MVSGLLHWESYVRSFTVYEASVLFVCVHYFYSKIFSYQVQQKRRYFSLEMWLKSTINLHIYPVMFIYGISVAWASD